MRNHSRFMTLVQHQLNRLRNGFAGIHGVVVDVHADELFRQPRLHVARKGHGVFQCLGVVRERVFNALAHHTAAFGLNVVRQRAQQGIAAQRQRQAPGILPPLAHIQNAMETGFGISQLSFVNNQAGVSLARMHSFQDSIKRRHHRNEIRFEYLHRQIRSGHGAGNRNPLALHFFRLHRVGGHNQGAVAIAHTGTGSHHHVFIRHIGISVIGNRA